MEEKTSWTQEERKALIAFAKGIAAFEENDYDTAKKCFEKAIEMDSSQYKSRIVLAQIYLTRNNKEKAISHLHKAISINKSCKDFLMKSNTFKDFFENGKLKI